jgi:quercetin dioxygenase-like cupin family protein
MGVIHRHTGDPGRFRWQDVAVETYDRPEVAGVTKQVVIGPGEGAHDFAVRYFEVAPGSASALEAHAHDHGVVVLCGEGRVRLGEVEHAIGSGDVVYVEPNERHQFVNTGRSPLGFLCVVVPPRSASHRTRS